MIRKLPTYLILLTTFSFVSCLSTKTLTKGESVFENDLSVLNGTYENTSASYKKAWSQYPLSSAFFHQFKDYYSEGGDSVHFVGKIKIEAVSKKHLRVDYIINDSVVKSKKLKGTLKNNHFVMNRKLILIGFPPILGFYKERKVAVGLTKEGYLKVMRGDSHCGGLLVMAAGDESYNTYYYANTNITETINEKAQKLMEELALKHPDKPIFYKTETNSVKSYVWLRQGTELIAYEISPDGTKEKIYGDQKPYVLDRSFFENQLTEVLDSNETKVGYMINIDGRLENTYHYVKLYKLASGPTPIDRFWLEIVRQDLLLMDVIHTSQYY